MKIEKIFSNRNIILLVTVLFFVWLMFFDRNNFLTLSAVDQKIETLKAERDFYRARITEDSMVIQGMSDSAFVERYARENFRLIRPGETMYLFKSE
ncbi:MAG: septum formation initiator family protein [Mucinivorans sp.]